ncbi:MAG: P-II family nitrogen regulator [Acidobacteriota bacterium]|nr:P-II family nitrogen regulator [Acidobacteriota bacterium]
MKLIIAVVRPHRLDEIVCALEDIEDFPGITVTDVEGFGQRLRTTSYDALNPFKLQKRIEIAANDEVVEPIVAAIRGHAHTGKKGDGIIVVVPIENAVLI